MLQACGLEGWRGDWEGQKNYFMFRQSSFSNLIVDRYIVFIKLRISSNKYHIKHPISYCPSVDDYYAVGILAACAAERAGKGHKKAC